MLRIIGTLIVVAVGAGLGSVIATLGGTAILETSQSAASADAVMKMFAIPGAMLGALVGFGKALAWSAEG